MNWNLIGIWYSSVPKKFFWLVTGTHLYPKFFFWLVTDTHRFQRLAMRLRSRDWDRDWFSWDALDWDISGTKVSGTAKSQALGLLWTLVCSSLISVQIFFLAGTRFPAVQKFSEVRWVPVTPGTRYPATYPSQNQTRIIMSKSCIKFKHAISQFSKNLLLKSRSFCFRIILKN